MKTKLIVALVIISFAAVAIVTAVGAQRGMGPGRPMKPSPGTSELGCPMWGLGPRIVQQLNLTQDQVNQLRQLRQDFWNDTQATREQLQTKFKQMIGLWTAAQPDVSQIKALASDIDALRAEIRDAGIDYMIRALSVLTPAQRDKLRTMIKDMGANCLKMCGGCCFCPCIGCGPCVGCGPGIGCGLGIGMGPGAGMGAGLGPRNATGPRAQMGTCPNMKK